MIDNVFNNLTISCHRNLHQRYFVMADSTSILDYPVTVPKDEEDCGMKIACGSRMSRKGMCIFLGVFIWIIACIPANIAAGIILFNYQTADPNETDKGTPTPISSNRTLDKSIQKVEMMANNWFNKTDRVRTIKKGNILNLIRHFKIFLSFSSSNSRCC